MSRASTTDDSALPGAGLLVVCAVILFAGYVGAIVRAPGAQAVAAERAAVDS